MSDLPAPAGDPSNDPQDPSKGKVPVLQPSDVREQQQVELQTLRQSAPPEPSAAEARAMALVAMMTDGDLSPEERDELRATFQANPDLLQAYVEQAVAHAVLEWRYMRKEDYADLPRRGTRRRRSPHPTRRRSFQVHGQLSLRPLSGDGSGMTPTLPPGMAVQFIDGPRRRHRRGPLVAGGFLAGAALAAALFLSAPWSQKRQQNPPLTAPPEPQQAAVYVGFDTCSAVGGTLRKQLQPEDGRMDAQGPDLSQVGVQRRGTENRRRKRPIPLAGPRRRPGGAAGTQRRCAPRRPQRPGTRCPRGRAPRRWALPARRSI